jgi:threonine dehydrogenase-like Zn-dependent dehydrogenase
LTNYASIKINNRGVFGLHAPGFHTEYGIADVKSVYKLPEKIDFDVGSLIGDTLGTAYHAIRRVGIQPGDTVAIWGLGPIGITTAQMANLAGAANVIAFALMGAYNIGLTVNTYPVSSVGIGLGVDYGIYLWGGCLKR